MPYVALDSGPYNGATREARDAAAADRWADLLSLRPDLQPAVALQHELLRLVSDLAELIDRGRLPRLSLPPRYLAAKLRRGVPALAGEPIPVPIAVLKPALVSLCGVLAAGGAGESAEHISACLIETRIDAGALLAASLKRDQAAIRAVATHQGLAPDLVWLVAELAVSPFVYVLQRSLFGKESTSPELHAALDAWAHGYCPMCGSWPALAEVAASRRVLRCSFCALAWTPNEYACVYCHEHGEKFVTAAPDEERKDRRLEVCGACGAYLKTIDVPTLTPFPLLAIGDLETTNLDVAAMERGYGRPPLKDFGRR
jgi:FdhE protein